MPDGIDSCRTASIQAGRHRARRELACAIATAVLLRDPDEALALLAGYEARLIAGYEESLIMRRDLQIPALVRREPRPGATPECRPEATPECRPGAVVLAEPARQVELIVELEADVERLLADLRQYGNLRRSLTGPGGSG